jgi:hypothetical protein
MPSQTTLATCDAVEALRRQRLTQAAIAVDTGLSPATVSRILKRRGLSRFRRSSPPRQARAMKAKRPARSST